MSDDGSSLNDVERTVRNILKARLGARATITKVKQDGDRIKVEVVSPFEFTWTANALDEVGAEAAELSKCAIDVSLSTWWPPK